MAYDPRRVSMLWPVELKEQVRAIAGEHGLTGFVIAAVQTRLTELAHAPPAPPPSHTLIPDTCPKCWSLLVDGECWTCPPPTPA